MKKPTPDQTEIMWAELAPHYDALYHWKDYRAECDAVQKIIAAKIKPPRKSLLDVACGTGNHLEFFQKRFDVEGVDQSRAMLKEAKGKLPGVPLHAGDMMNFDLGRQFDIVVCLFSSIAYLRTYRNLRTALNNFAAHLRPGGLLLIEPFISADKFESGLVHGSTVGDENVKISRLNVTKKRGNIAILDFHFLLATKKSVRYFHDPHEIALYDDQKFLEICRQVGFRAQYRMQALMKDRGLYIAVKK